MTSHWGARREALLVVARPEGLDEREHLLDRPSGDRDELEAEQALGKGAARSTTREG